MTANRLNEIDLLRFIAAMAVVLFHYCFRGYMADNLTTMPYPLLAPIAQYGYLGVDLFFMISGFVISMSASSGSLRKFFVSRVARLYPAFWVGCTLTSLCIILFHWRFPVTLSQYLINMTMLNVFFNVASIDGSYWSLIIEIRFYLLVSLVLLLGQIAKMEWLLVIWLTLAIVLDRFPTAYLNTILIVSYAAYFIAGAMLYEIWSRGFTWLRFTVVVIAFLVSLKHALGRIPSLEKAYAVDFSSYVIVGCIAIFFIVLFLVAIRRTGWFGRKEWIVIGALTYPLYLIHQNIGYMIFNMGYPAVNNHVLLGGTLILMLGISYLIHVGVEKKFSKRLGNAVNRVLEQFQFRLSRKAV